MGIFAVFAKIGIWESVSVGSKRKIGERISPVARWDFYYQKNSTGGLPSALDVLSNSYYYQIISSKLIIEKSHYGSASANKNGGHRVFRQKKVVQRKEFL